MCYNYASVCANYLNSVVTVEIYKERNEGKIHLCLSLSSRESLVPLSSILAPPPPRPRQTMTASAADRRPRPRDATKTRWRAQEADLLPPSLPPSPPSPPGDEWLGDGSHSQTRPLHNVSDRQRGGKDTARGKFHAANFPRFCATLYKVTYLACVNGLLAFSWKFLQCALVDNSCQ